MEIESTREPTYADDAAPPSTNALSTSVSPMSKPTLLGIAMAALGHNMEAGLFAQPHMANCDEIFFELEPAALAANGPLPRRTEPLLPPPGTYPSGEELARRLENFVNVELNAAELKGRRAKRRK